MTTGGFRGRLTDETVQFGGMVTTCAPAMVEVFGDVGFDFAFVDLEHGGPSPYDSERLADLVRAGETAGVDLVVRLPSGDPPLVRKVLDTGVGNVLVPRVETAEAVRTAAAATRFSYDGGVGDRGVGSARATRWGGAMDSGYPARADETVSLGVMIETRAAIENLESIVTVSGVDFALLGHYDLAVSLGESDPVTPAVEEAVDRFERVCREAGLPVGRYCGTDEDAIDDAIEEGYEVVLLGDETAAVREVYGGLVGER